MKYSENGTFVMNRRGRKNNCFGDFRKIFFKARMNKLNFYL